MVDLGRRPGTIKETASMYAEYGARVKIDGIVDIPDGTRGTITSDVPLFGHAPNWEITLDGSGQRITMHVTEFDVTLSPSETAYRLTTRWSVDECLAALIQVADIGATHKDCGIYQGALVFELYRLNAHAEDVVQLDIQDDYCDGWESGTCEDGEYITSEGYYAPLNGGDDGTGEHDAYYYHSC